MPMYAIATIHITDRDTYASYERQFLDIFSRYEGKVLSVDDAGTVIEGPLGKPRPRIVLLEFPSEQSFRAWYESEDYQRIVAIRFASSQGEVMLIKGLDT